MSKIAAVGPPSSGPGAEAPQRGALAAGSGGGGGSACAAARNSATTGVQGGASSVEVYGFVGWITSAVAFGGLGP
jgi:hypothetical protein